MSWDATPLVSEMDYLNVHMDYGIDLGEFWRAQVTYDWLKTDMKQADELPLIWRDALGSNTFDGRYKNSTYSAELTYKRTIGNNNITAGVKGRYKGLDSFTNYGLDSLVSPFTTEKIATAFFQDQYALDEQQLLTLGISYNKISRNGTVKNDNLLQLRLGYIYNSEHWSYKAYISRTQFALEPLSRYLDPLKYQDVEPQTTVGITQEVSYHQEKYNLRLMLLLMQDEDGIVQNDLIDPSGDTKYFFTFFNYDYSFDSNNKIDMQLYYANYKDIFNLDQLEDTSGYLSFVNVYENFDFYNGVVWHYNTLDNKNYFDLTSSISWNIDTDLTLTLKGDNLLNKAKKSELLRLDPLSGSVLQPLKVSPIDQRIIIELEYMF